MFEVIYTHTETGNSISAWNLSSLTVAQRLVSGALQQSADDADARGEVEVCRQYDEAYDLVRNWDPSADLSNWTVTVRGVTWSVKEVAA